MGEAHTGALLLLLLAAGAGIEPLADAFSLSSSRALSMSSAAVAWRLARQDASACSQLLSRNLRSGAAAQLLWKVSQNEGQVLDEEEWYGAHPRTTCSCLWVGCVRTPRRSDARPPTSAAGKARGFHFSSSLL